MKMQTSKKVHYDSGPNMTPLVDVVMVILIFLMLVGQFGGAEHYLLSNIPFSEKGMGAAKPTEGIVPDEPLDIRVDSPTPDTWTAVAGKIKTSDALQLTGQLKRMHDEFKAAGKTTDKIQIVISPGGDVQYDFLMKVYEAAMSADFTKISFARSH
jgi:biopolymer transport protein ExbD